MVDADSGGLASRHELPDKETATVGRRREVAHGEA